MKGLPVTNRIMYDGITPSSLPLDGAIYASYVDGQWPNFHEFGSLKLPPGRLFVSIAVDPAHVAHVLDVETFDATPGQAPLWATRMRARHIVPTVYCSESVWPAVRRAFHAQEVAPPLWWIANYDRTRADGLIAGTVAVQFDSQPGFDTSIVAAHWPGLDGSPHPTKPSGKDHHPIHTRGRVHHVVQAGDTIVGIAAGWGVKVAELEHANPHAGHPAGNFDLIWPGDVLYKP